MLAAKGVSYVVSNHKLNSAHTFVDIYSGKWYIRQFVKARLFTLEIELRESVVFTSLFVMHPQNHVSAVSLYFASFV